MKLFEIEEEIRECIDEETGEVLDAEKLESLQLAKEKKLEGVALWIKEDKAEIEAIQSTIKCLQDKLEGCRKRIENKRQWLQSVLNGGKLKTALVSVYYSNRDSVVIDEQAVNSLPEQFIKIEKTPIKTEILKTLKEGGYIGGCTLETKTSMIIR